MNLDDRSETRHEARQTEAGDDRNEWRDRPVAELSKPLDSMRDSEAADAVRHIVGGMKNTA